MLYKQELCKMTTPHYFTNYFDNNVEYVPFYIKTTGTNCFAKGRFEKADRLLSQEIDIYWGICGSGSISTADSKTILGKDHVTFCYPREEPCRNALSDQWVFRWIRIAGPLALAIISSYGFPRHIQAYSEYPEKLFSRLDELCAEKDLFSIRRAGAVLLDILAHADGNSGQYSSVGHLALRADEYIKEHFTDPELTINQLAEHFQTSRTTLTQAFAEKGLPSPGRRLLNLRLLRARELLYGTDLSVAQMSKLCGFADVHTFTRFIKRSLGNSPLRCRKEYAETNRKNAKK